MCSVSNAIRIFLISMELEGARSAIYELFGNIRPNLLRSISGSIPNVCTAFRTKQKNDLLSDTIINNKLGMSLSLSLSLSPSLWLFTRSWLDSQNNRKHISRSADCTFDNDVSYVNPAIMYLLYHLSVHRYSNYRTHSLRKYFRNLHVPHLLEYPRKWSRSLLTVSGVNFSLFLIPMKW